MEKNNFTLEERNSIWALFDKYTVALLKISLNENGEKHIDKVYLDGKQYDIPSDELDFQLYLSNGAIDLIREKGSILGLSREEKNFVIKNHQSWIMLRDSFELNGEISPELYSVGDIEKKQPYEIWCQDFCDALGDKRFYPKKNILMFQQKMG